MSTIEWKTIANSWRAPKRDLLWVFLPIFAMVVAYAPTLLELARGPWQTEQEGHGPLIIAAALWLFWQCRSEIANLDSSSAPIAGWAILLSALVALFLSRNQNFLPLEAFSIIPMLVGYFLLVGGWPMIRILAFPIFFLIFAVPVPDTIIVALTVPLKVLISDAVTQVLYALGYPIAQNGVMIMIGSYQLLVKDACSGMNSIFALSAIGLFYVYAFRWESKSRGFILLAFILPITIIANFIRVIALVLIAYYGGIELLDGPVHDLTGIALFIVAIILMFLADAALGLLSYLLHLSSDWMATKRNTLPDQAI